MVDMHLTSLKLVAVVGWKLLSPHKPLTSARKKKNNNTCTLGGATRQTIKYATRGRKIIKKAPAGWSRKATILERRAPTMSVKTSAGPMCRRNKKQACTCSQKTYVLCYNGYLYKQAYMLCYNGYLYKQTYVSCYNGYLYKQAYVYNSYLYKQAYVLCYNGYLYKQVYAVQQWLSLQTSGRWCI